MIQIANVSDIKNYMDELAEKCLRIYEQHSLNIQLFDGVTESLTHLREKGIRLRLIADGPAEMQREKIRALGIVPLEKMGVVGATLRSDIK